MEPLQAFVSRAVLFTFCIVGILVTTFVALLRLYVRITKQSRLLEDDFALFSAVVLYIGLAICYIADLPYLYEVMDFLAGKPSDITSVERSYSAMMRYNWPTNILFWAVLWSVKISLLLFFRRVMLRTTWMRMWWAVLVFTILTFIGCIVTLFTSCDTLGDDFILGKCVSERNTRAQIASLYYSFFADVVTDLLIMALPLRIVLGLQMSRRRDKYKLAALFSVQLLAIIFSVLRVAFTWVKTGFRTPSPPWLGVWAIIEGMVAIIVGCIPAISQIFRAESARIPASAQRYPGLRRPESTGTSGDSYARKQPNVELSWKEDRDCSTTDILLTKTGSISRAVPVGA